MSGKLHLTWSAMAPVPSDKKESSVQPASSLYEMRLAVDVSEDGDALLTGMSRSLDRRLLALNLEPIPPASEYGYMKVA